MGELSANSILSFKNIHYLSEGLIIKRKGLFNNSAIDESNHFNKTNEKSYKWLTIINYYVNIQI